jgi:hypothetical protein
MEAVLEPKLRAPDGQSEETEVVMKSGLKTS